MSKKILISAIFVGIISAVVVFMLTKTISGPRTDKNNSTNDTGSTQTSLSPSTIGTQWQWQESYKPSQSQTTVSSGELLPFTPQSVYDALQAVKIDEDANVILNHDALISLDEALERIYNKLDNHSLRILQDLIKQSLPGKVGEQLAQIVGNYHGFLGAKEEFSRMDESLAPQDIEETVESVENDEALYNELQALREIHLGTEVTNSLFRVSNANAKFMFDSMKLERDSILSHQQKQQKRQEINQHHIEQSINVMDWSARYQSFVTAKQNIITTSLSDDEKRKQLSELLSQHFDSDERVKIRHLALEQL